ncbi:ribosomal oxygenase 1 [Linepithema humile]|uniref:ribosomal oxygenase 1 n=1 Tax=Linepithema humile TaxID=83485 RepID=UPI0006233FD9|nr:PREDICTED: bifunctional lysine-specific demethylase and histidyl-hydroxylase NO66 [Linepithema humile]
MSGNLEAVSAFSVYSAKRKNIEQPLKSKKKKLKHFSQKITVSNQKNVKQKNNNQILKGQKIKNKCTLNVAVKTKHGNITKKGNLKIFKNNILGDKAHVKFLQLNEKKKLKQINNVRKCVYKELKLKGAMIEKEKNKNFSKGETTETENVEKQDDDNSLNDANNSVNIEYFSDSNPIVNSQKLFKWLIYPLKIENFFKENWEKTPLHIKRNKPKYYKNLMSTPMLDKILREKHILFSKNIDITSYSNGVRETHNPEGTIRAFPSVVWDYYLNDCSVRMLNPQTFIPQLHALNATLQEFFGCFVGANSYLTPPNSQGFAPHYDDIEAFILQIEGKKRWRLYMPPNENEYLPRYSSKNFNQLEIGEPILDTIVEAGDLVYLPRGTIHQGETIDDTHSLHVTLSVYQKNSWCDLLEKLLPQALKRATEVDSRFREGLPLDYLRYTGIVYNTNVKKSIFKKKIKNLINHLIDYIDVDDAADLMAKGHIHDFLPPFLTKNEQKCSVVENGEIMVDNGVVKNYTEITANTRIRLLRTHCIRLIKEDDTFMIYYSTDNSKEYHEMEIQSLEVDESIMPGISKLVTSYPNFIRVGELPIGDEDVKIAVVKDLWEKNLIITEVPLCSTDSILHLQKEK